MPQIKWAEKAVSDLESLDKAIARRIIDKISWFGENFENLTPEMLSNELNNLYKIRAGDYRIVYSINKNILQIEWIGHRKDVYR
jgi:mRNA interferase RelE/StbE